MSDAPETEPDLLPMPADIGVIRIFPRPVVWAAGLIIIGLGGFGLYQGIHGALTGGAGGNGQGDQPTGDAVSAAAAAPISGNPQWSALNGPAMGPTNAPKAASAAPANTDETDDSSADESAAPPAVSAAPPAASAQAPAPPPPSTTESAQPASAGQ